MFRESSPPPVLRSLASASRIAASYGSPTSRNPPSRSLCSPVGTPLAAGNIVRLPNVYHLDTEYMPSASQTLAHFGRCGCQVSSRRFLAERAISGLRLGEREGLTVATVSPGRTYLLAYHRCKATCGRPKASQTSPGHSQGPVVASSPNAGTALPRTPPPAALGPAP